MFRMAVLWAMKALLDDACIEVTDWGPKGPVLVDRSTGEVIRQTRAGSQREIRQE